MSKDFFPPKPDVKPTIYAYELVGVGSHKGLLKVGYTIRNAKERVKEQLGTAQIQYRIVLIEDAIRNDGTTFTDHEVHHHLKKKSISRKDGEWFKCSLKDVRSAINDIRERKISIESRGLNFKMRPEQKAAVEKTSDYFQNSKKKIRAKSSFSLECQNAFWQNFCHISACQKMGWSKILVMTFKPAVESAWDDDLKEHIDFTDWQFVSASENTLWHKDINEKKPFVCFGSFQDYLGKNKSTGESKQKTNGYTIPSGIVLFLTNIIMEHGERMLKNF
jgi:hypothetical protein